ncbi:MAG: hypothetical protein LKI23_03095 [Bifidobacterium crudilactis]|jgi:hypothetical protein|nr:hypothetical protein [Bifidobacterium crudilactis]
MELQLFLKRQERHQIRGLQYEADSAEAKLREFLPRHTGVFLAVQTHRAARRLLQSSHDGQQR